MPLADTPSNTNMEEEESVLVLSDLEEVEVSDFEGTSSDDGMDVDGVLTDTYVARLIVPERDDAKCVFKKHNGPVYCCHLDPRSGNLAVTGSKDDMAYVWETQTGNVVLECKGHEDTIVSVEFSHDGTYVATGDMIGIVQVWEIASRSLAWKTNVGELVWVKWHHGAHVLLAGITTGEVYVWRVPTGECKVLPTHGSQPMCSQVLPDGKRVAVGHVDGSVKVMDIKSTQVLHHILAHDSHITSMDAHPDNNLLITGGINGNVVIITTQTGKVVSTLRDMVEGVAQEVETVGFCTDMSVCLAAAGTLSGILYIWDISRSVIRHKILDTEGVMKLIWVKNSTMLFAACLDGVILLIDALSGVVKAKYLGHSSHIMSINLSTDNKTLLSVSEDETARVFNPISPNL